jgi:ribosomal protein S18 acetylase RimI-like enzyme
MINIQMRKYRGDADKPEMTPDWRLRTLQNPDYHPQLDVIVAATNSNLVAFCIGWLDHHSGDETYEQMELLGCHPDCRKYALGRVALCESLRRLQQLGARQVILETDNYRNTAFRFYESLGFQVSKDILIYRKDYNEKAY